jgi:hypothetical protein
MDIIKALDELKTITDNISAEEVTKITDVLLKFGDHKYKKGLEDAQFIYQMKNDVFQS